METVSFDILLAGFEPSLEKKISEILKENHEGRRYQIKSSSMESLFMEEGWALADVLIVNGGLSEQQTTRFFEKLNLQGCHTGCFCRQS